MKKVIFVSGPYSGEVQANIIRAELVSLRLLRCGWSVLTPHKNTGGFHVFKEFNDDFWMDICFSLLSKCDAIFMMIKYEKSKGARMELEFAKAHSIPVYYQKNGFPKSKEL
jgi:hypothetical protein